LTISRTPRGETLGPRVAAVVVGFLEETRIALELDVRLDHRLSLLEKGGVGRRGRRRFYGRGENEGGDGNEHRRFLSTRRGRAKILRPSWNVTAPRAVLTAGVE
jgi:hypothetical protein